MRGWGVGALFVKFQGPLALGAVYDSEIADAGVCLTCVYSRLPNGLVVIAEEDERHRGDYR